MNLTVDQDSTMTDWVIFTVIEHHIYPCPLLNSNLTTNHTDLKINNEEDELIR